MRSIAAESALNITESRAACPLLRGCPLHQYPQTRRPASPRPPDVPCNPRQAPQPDAPFLHQRPPAHCCLLRADPLKRTLTHCVCCCVSYLPLKTQANPRCCATWALPTSRAEAAAPTSCAGSPPPGLRLHCSSQPPRRLAAWPPAGRCSPTKTILQVCYPFPHAAAAGGHLGDSRPNVH